MALERHQRLYFALGELAYALAIADGRIQAIERQRLHELVAGELRSLDPDYQVAEIIFHQMDKDHVQSAETAYQWALEEIRTCAHFLTPAMRALFPEILIQLAKAHGSVTEEEQRLVEQLRQDLEEIPQ